MKSLDSRFFTRFLSLSSDKEWRKHVHRYKSDDVKGLASLIDSDFSGRKDDGVSIICKRIEDFQGDQSKMESLARDVNVAIDWTDDDMGEKSEDQGTEGGSVTSEMVQQEQREEQSNAQESSHDMDLDQLTQKNKKIQEEETIRHHLMKKLMASKEKELERKRNENELLQKE